MSAAPWVNANVQFFDSAGLVLAGGKLYSYAAGGTSTLQATYTDSTGLVANTNPVILDSAGRANVWLGAASYRFDLYNASAVLVWSVDNVTGSALSTITTASANMVYAGPSLGAAAAPTFRTLVAADIPDISATYAKIDLSNLGTTNLNATLLAQTGVDLGSAAKAFRNIFFWGSGTFSTTSMELTGTPTGNRVWTFQDSTDTVVGRITTDLFKNKTVQRPLTAISADGAVDPHTAAYYQVTKAGVCAMTLLAPTSGTDDGKIIVITSDTANAHTLTTVGLLQTGSASVNVATYAAFAGASLTLQARAGKWQTLAQVGIAFS